MLSRIIPLVIIMLFSSWAAHAEEPIGNSLLPDVYADTGLSTSQSFYSGSQEVKVDPFTGMATISVTDLAVPGNGGMGITVSRSYQSLQPGVRPAYSPVGAGWTLHYGRVEIADINKMCSMSHNVITDDNPVFKSPDGTTDLLVIVPYGHRQNYNDVSYVSRSGAVLFCELDGFYVTQPDGTRYDFGQVVYGSSGTWVWHVTKATDVNGNVIDIRYIDSNYNGGTGKLISEITGTSFDGKVEFIYDTSNPASPLLSELKYNGSKVKSYTYYDNGYTAYDADPELYSSNMALSSVTDAEGLSWFYSYYPFESSSEQAGFGPNDGSLSQVETPLGGVIALEYAIQVFNPESEFKKSRVVVRKTQSSGRPAGGAEWLYSYSQSQQGDVTVVKGPDGTRTFEHVGYQESSVSGSVWRMGTLKRVSFDGNDGNNREEIYQWEGQALSGEKTIRAQGLVTLYTPIDEVYKVPVMISKKITQDGNEYVTDYSDYTAGYSQDSNVSIVHAPIPNLPQTVVETSPGGTRNIQRRYYLNKNKWVMGPQTDEFLRATGWVYNASHRDEKGRVNFSFDFGKGVHYEHDSEGNVISESYDGFGSISYSGYQNGQPTRIDYPDGGYEAHKVDSYGRILSTSDALGNKTTYTYDFIGRMTSMTPASGVPTTLNWAGNRVTEKHGEMLKASLFDGFGRVWKKVFSAPGTPTVEIYTEYDYAGRVLSERIVGTTETVISYQYDSLGRMKKMTSPGGAKTISYGQASKSVKDERGNSTTYYYDEYGEPGGYVNGIHFSEPGMGDISIERNLVGQILSVSQGGITRTYNYNDAYLLESMSEPESGLNEKYSYYGDGTLRAVDYVDLLGVTQYFIDYYYDPMRRLIRKRYSDGSSIPRTDLGIGYHETALYNTYNNYDLAGNLKQSKIVRSGDIVVPTNPVTYVPYSEEVVWDMNYDSNYQMLSEILTVNDKQFSLAYAYNDRGNLQSITYPSGKQINLNPYDNGWPSMVGDYVTDITYHHSGAPERIEYGNGDVYSANFDNRMLLDNFRVNGISGSLIDYDYQYDEVGNITKIDDLLDNSYSRSMSYDGVNRLVTASGYWGDASYEYDQIGNLSSKTVGDDSLIYNYSVTNKLASVTGDVQRSYAYDSYGSVISDGNVQFERGPRGEVIRYNLQRNAEGTRIYYDDRNRRAYSVTANGNPEYFVYGSNGKLMFSLDEGVGSYKEFFHLGSRNVATQKITLECGDDYDNDGLPHCIEKEWMLDPFMSGDESVDSDGDGLTNIEEYQSGTSGILVDTDGDMLPDAWEVNNGLDGATNDSSADPDEDGLDNLLEYELDTDPKDSDTDQDMMPDGWEYNNALNYLVDDSAGDPDHDGLTNLDEYAEGTDPKNGDSDNDVLPDGWEFKYGLDNELDDAGSDPDSDGYTNLQEYQLGTDPTIADPPRPVTHFSVSNGENSAFLQWKPSALSGSYRVYYSSSSFESADEAEGSFDVNGTAYLHQGLPQNISIYYRVAAVNGFGESGLSRIQTASPSSMGWFFISGGYKHVGLDAQQNRYTAWILGGNLYIQVTYIDGRPTLLLNTAISSDDEIAEFEVSESGVAVAVTWGTDNHAYSNVNVYDGSNEIIKRDSLFHNTIRDLEIDLNGAGQGVLAFIGLKSSGGGTLAVPHAAVINPDNSAFKLLTAKGRIDKGATYRDARKIGVAHNNKGETLIVWGSSIWDSDQQAELRGYSVVDQSAVPAYYTGWESPILMHQASSYYREPTVKINDHGDALWSYSDIYDPEAYAIKLDGVWNPVTTLDEDFLKMDLGANGLVKAWETRDVTYAQYGDISQGALEWLPAEKLGRNSSLHYVIANGELFGGHVVWTNKNGANLVTAYNSNEWVDIKTLDSNQMTAIGNSQATSDSVGNLYFDQGTSYSGIHAALPMLVAPVAGATSSPLTVYGGASFTLQGTATDSDGSIVSTSWSQVSGTPSTIVDENVTNFSQTRQAPVVQADEVLVFEFSATDDSGLTDTAKVSVTVQDAGAAPIANAGADQTVNEGIVVELTGAASTDSDGDIVTYQWQQLSGNMLTLDYPDCGEQCFLFESVESEVIRFTAPAYSEPENGNALYSFELKVIDSKGNTSVDTVMVHVDNNDGSYFVLDAGEDVSVDENAQIALTAKSTTDANTQVSSYLWSCEAGVTLSDATVADPVLSTPFIDDEDNLVTCNVTAFNNLGHRRSDSISITVINSDGSVSVPEDTTPPDVSYEYTYVTEGKGKKTREYFDVSLTINEPGTVFINWNSTELTLVGSLQSSPVYSGWYIYDGVVRFELNDGYSEGTIQYRGVDDAGNESMPASFTMVKPSTKGNK